MSAPPLPSGLRDWKATNAPSSVRLTHEALSSGPKGTGSRDIVTDSCARAKKADEKRNSATQNPGIFLRNGNIGLGSFARNSLQDAGTSFVPPNNLTFSSEQEEGLSLLFPLSSCVFAPPPANGSGGRALVSNIPASLAKSSPCAFELKLKRQPCLFQLSRHFGQLPRESVQNRHNFIDDSLAGSHLHPCLDSVGAIASVGRRPNRGKISEISIGVSKQPGIRDRRLLRQVRLKRDEWLSRHGHQCPDASHGDNVHPNLHFRLKPVGKDLEQGRLRPRHQPMEVPAICKGELQDVCPDWKGVPSSGFNRAGYPCSFFPDGAPDLHQFLLAILAG